MPRLLFTFIAICFAITGTAQQKPAEMASRFIGNLTTLQLKKVQYTFTDNERFNWHFVPKSRKGIAIEELNEQQKKFAFDLLATCLSENGTQKVKDVILLEGILKQLESRGDDDYRDAGKYYFTMFGNPQPNNIWGWRIEGHHISFTFSAQNNRLVSGTPGFLGANPAIVPSGQYKGKETLKEETAAGFALLHSLNTEQLNKAVINSKALPEIVTYNSRKAMIDHPQGIYYSELNKDQQLLMMQLIEVYIHRYTKLFADEMLKEIKATDVGKLQFAWAGAQQKGATEGYYYRIQGPTIIIEYDNTQNDANHVHTVLRDLKNDFGGDELAEHYRKNHTSSY